MAVIAEIQYFAEEIDLYSPEGNFIANGDFRLSIEVEGDGDWPHSDSPFGEWRIDDVQYRNGQSVQAGKYGYALSEIVKASIRRPENKRFMREIEDEIAEAERNHRPISKGAGAYLELIRRAS